MIPVLIGAAVGLAGAALLRGDDKPQQPDTRKRQVSEDYVLQYLRQAGKELPCKTRKVSNRGGSSGARFIPSGNLSKDFGRIEDMLDNPNVSDKFISDALSAIDQQAQWDDVVLNFIAYYRDRLSKR